MQVGDLTGSESGDAAINEAGALSDEELAKREPVTDLLAALRAQTAEFTQEERFAELERLEQLQKSKTVDPLYQGPLGLLRYMALIHPEDIAPLMVKLEEAERGKEKPGYHYREAILKSWAEYDREGMEAWLRSQPAWRLRHLGTSSLVEAWAGDGGVAAWKRMVQLTQSLGTGDDPNYGSRMLLPLVTRKGEGRQIGEEILKMENETYRDWTIRELIEGMSGHDFQGALEVVSMIESESEADKALQSALQAHLNGPNPDFQAIAGLFEGEVGDQTMMYSGMFLMQWNRKDPDACQAWVQSNAPHFQSILESTRNAFGDSAPKGLELLRPSEQFEALVGNSSEGLRSMIEYRAETLAEANPRKAITVLKGLPPEQQERYGPKIVCRLAQFDAELAQRALAVMEEGEGKDSAAEQLYESWKAYDPTGAEAWKQAR